jgi:hypothetical protein
MWLILVNYNTKTCVLAFVLLSVFLLSLPPLHISAQNEAMESVSEGIPSTNDTQLASVNNGSTPILFEVSSQSERDMSMNQGSFKAQIAWIPNAIGSENTFSIKFLNTSSGEELQNVTYDIMLFNEENHLSESHRSNQQAASQKYVFPESGLYTLKIDNIENTTAKINLPIQVVPEFAGAGPATAIIAGLLILILLLVRFKTHRLGLSVR